MILNPDHPFAPNIAGLWLPGANGRTGYTLRDLSGRHNHGTLTNGPTWDSRSHVGGFGSLSFDGSNDYVLCPAFPTLGAASMSVSMWFRTTSSGIMFAGSNRNAGGETKGWDVLSVSSRMYFRFGDGTSAFETSGGVTTSDGNWHQLIGVIDRAAANKYNYIDGLLQHTQSISGAGGAETAIDVKFGEKTGSSSRFVGQIGPTALLDRALSASEVWHLYEESLQAYPTLLWQPSTKVWSIPAGGGGAAEEIPSAEVESTAPTPSLSLDIAAPSAEAESTAPAPSLALASPAIVALLASTANGIGVSLGCPVTSAECASTAPDVGAGIGGISEAVASAEVASTAPGVGAGLSISLTSASVSSSAPAPALALDIAAPSASVASSAPDSAALLSLGEAISSALCESSAPGVGLALDCPLGVATVVCTAPAVVAGGVVILPSSGVVVRTSGAWVRRGRDWVMVSVSGSKGWLRK